MKLPATAPVATDRASYDQGSVGWFTPLNVVRHTTMLFASDKETSKLTVFIGASLALVFTSAIGVVAGSAISHYVSEKTLHYLAGIGFVAIGVWMLIKA